VERGTNLPVNSACSKLYPLGCLFLATEFQGHPVLQTTVTVSSEDFGSVQVEMVGGNEIYRRRVQLKELGGEMLPFVLP
jgi:hypothetical protein